MVGRKNGLGQSTEALEICSFHEPIGRFDRMRFVEVFNMKMNLQDDIQTASLLNKHEAVILTNTGEVFLFNFKKQKQDKLFETNPTKGIQYSDGGFDPAAESSIYTMDDIIVVVNNYKKHGFILNRTENYLLHFSRTDYYAAISKYPIALFKNEKGQPHLIYGVDWNRLQIANLTTRQVLTATKSLIEVDAEQQHFDFYKKHKEDNKLFWPSEYDYFYGKLLMSPNGEKFLSAGWVWGSYDCCKIYDLADFISNPRISDETIGFWENNNNAICFVDNETIAVIYDPSVEEANGANKDDPHEIRLYHADGQGDKETIVLKPSLDLGGAELFYHQTNQCFYTFSEKIGTAAIALSGEIIIHQPTKFPQNYDLLHDCFICYDKDNLNVFQIE